MGIGAAAIEKLVEILVDIFGYFSEFEAFFGGEVLFARPGMVVVFFFKQV
jgi:hypothetical protein